MCFPFSFSFSLQPSLLQPIPTQMHTMAFFPFINVYIRIDLGLQKSCEHREEVPHTQFPLLFMFTLVWNICP